MVFERSSCDSGIKVGIAPIVDFIAGMLELLMLAATMFLLNLVPCVREKNEITLIAPVYFLVMFYAMALALVVSIAGILGLSFEFVEADFVKWVIFRVCTEGIAIFFLHNGIGVRALKHAILGGTAWAFISGGVPVLVYYLPGSGNPDLHGYVIANIVFASLLVLFYFVTWVTPQSMLHRRPAMLSYSLMNMFVLFFFILAMAVLIINNETSSCEVEIFVGICYDLQPFIILYAIRQDSLFWQGLYQAPGSNLNEPLLGVWEMGREHITVLTDTMNQLERKVVPIVPFAQLVVDTSKFFSGGTARVYRGLYKKNQVAIKFAFTIELTPETVISFCAEATVLNSLQHPNIVKCYGVAIMPPALCLVTEFCQFGSLYDFLHSLELVIRESRTSNYSNSAHSGPRNTGGSSTGGPFPVDEGAKESDVGSTSRLTWQSTQGGGSPGSATGAGADDPKRSSNSSYTIDVLPEPSNNNSLTLTLESNGVLLSESSPSKVISPRSTASGSTGGGSSRPTSLLASSIGNLQESLTNRQSGTAIPAVDSKANLLDHTSNPIFEAKVMDISHVNVVLGARSRADSSTPQLSQLTDNAGDTNQQNKETRTQSADNGRPSYAEYAAKLAELLARRQVTRSDDRSSNDSVISTTTLEKMGFSIDLRRSSKDSNDGLTNGRSSKFRQSNGTNKMKSLANVMTSQAMGFGLGLLNNNSEQTLNGLSLKDIQQRDSAGSRASSNVSAGQLLASSGNKTRMSLGATLPLPLRMSLARDAIRGVAFLHSNGLIHCDIKSLNFLVSSDLVIKLADLGEARSTETRTSEVGQIPRNINWSSPESLSHSHISKSADVWSLALVLSEIFSGLVPFDGLEYRDISFDDFRKQVEGGLRPRIPQKMIDAYPWLADMMKQAWAFHPQDRLTADEMLQLFDKKFSTNY